MTTFFTSDTYFGHANIIKYCNRPFSSVDEMNEVMIYNWNRAVDGIDTVYHLGDFGFSKTPDLFFNRLHGHKHLIIGNHDYQYGDALKLPWESQQDVLQLIVNNTKVFLNHYGMRVWDGSFHGSIHLYGHSHGRLPGNTQSCDVGVDSWNFVPVTLRQIQRRLVTLTPFKED
tara:strand:+ start:4944 stop:5459 length:516 start_codon:yes stop_codon:yes gene_type:complete